MISRRNLIGGSAILAGAAAVSGRVQAAVDPRSGHDDVPGDAAAARSVKRARLSTGRHAERLDTALAHEWRLEGIPFGRGAGDARDRARHEGASVGLQRAVARANPRVRGRRQGPYLRHQQAARAHNHSLARHAGAERNGRRRRIDTAAHQAGPDLRLRIRAQEERNVHVSPACRRDGADGDGNDGIFRCAPTGSQAASCRPRFRLSHEQLRHRPRQLFAQGHDHDRFQPVDLEQPGVSRH